MRINIRLKDFSFHSKLNLWDKPSRKSLSVSSKLKTFFPFCFCFIQHRGFSPYFFISLVRICHHPEITPMCSLYVSYRRLIYFVTQSLYLSLPHPFPSFPSHHCSGNHLVTYALLGPFMLLQMARFSCLFFNEYFVCMCEGVYTPRLLYPFIYWLVYWWAFGLLP